MSSQEVIKETKPRMEHVVDDFKRKLAQVRTGRANISLLDGVMVDYYGTPTPLSQMASVATPEPQMITVSPWDATQINAIEKAITVANLGVNPSSDGKIVRVPVPPLNEERRKQLAKQVQEIAEEHRIGARHARQAANDKLKKMLKDKEISEDEERSGLEDVQKLTNTTTARIDELAKLKEVEVLTV